MRTKIKTQFILKGSTSLEHHLTLVHNSSQLVPTNKGTVIDKVTHKIPYINTLEVIFYDVSFHDNVVE